MFTGCEQLKKMYITLKPWAPVVLRIVLGIIFMAHGSQKLFGWFGGGGFADTASGFEAMGLTPGWLNAALGGGGEFFGGLMVFLGMGTRFGAFLIAATMVVAIGVVHLKNGLFAQDGGFEYPLLCLAAAISLMFSGGGTASVDKKVCPVDSTLCK